jgi:CBS domain-containing protein
MLKVKDVLAIKKSSAKAGIFTIRSDQNFYDALSLLTLHDIGSVVVMDQEKVIGMLTFRELLNEARLLLGKANGDVRLVKSFMQASPLICCLDDSTDDIRTNMLEKHARYVPVIDKDELVGVISLHDLAKAEMEEHAQENRLLKAYIRDWPEEDVAEKSVSG